MPRVLVVEDDPTNARLFEVILTRMGGFDVAVTEDGDDVLARVRDGVVDAVVMDVSLTNTTIGGQKVDGIRLCRALKDDSTSSLVPVILATAHATLGSRESFIEQSGADDCVTKPITKLREFVDLVRRRIDLARSAHS